MFVTALLLAAIQAPSPSQAIVGPQDKVIPVKPAVASVRDLAVALDHCRGLGLQLVDSLQPAGRIQRLGDLPMANHTLTVLRSVEGCPVSSTIRFNVGR